MLTGWMKLMMIAGGTAAVSGLVATVGLPTPRGGAPGAGAASGPELATPASTAPASRPEAATAAGGTGRSAVAPPRFDVVRVEPSGQMVVAGRGEPGALVELLRNGAVHDQARIDSAGQFAMLPPPLAVGTHELTLQQALVGGQGVTASQSVTVSVREPGAGPALVARLSPDQPTEVISAAAPPLADPASSTAPGVAITAIEAEEGGRMFASGSAPAGSTVRFYLNDTYLGSAVASPDRRWSLTIAHGLQPGEYRVRADQVDPRAGAVVARAQAAFSYAPKDAPKPGSGASEVAVAANDAVASSTPAALTVAQIRTATVVRGDNLWRISKRVYGHGLRYTVIYDANQHQITDPHRIFPGQLFVLPGEPRS